MSRYENRTLFYSLALKGTGTGQVESFRSYIPRLAMAHSLTPFKLLELLYEKYPMDAIGTAIRSTLTTWDVQTLAEKGTQVRERLEAATGVSLDGCSMSRFQEVFSARNLMRRSGWLFCPHCIAEDEGMYSRLLWDIQSVNACPSHGTYLLPTDACGKPELRLPLNNRVYSSTACSTCGSIGFSCMHLTTVKATAAEVAQARLMEKLLSLGPLTKEGVCRDSLRRGLRELVAGAFENKPTVASIECGLTRSGFRNWLRGSNVPALSGLLKVCERTGADITELLRGKYVKVRASSQVVKGPHVMRRLTLDAVAVRAQLVHAAMSSPPKSLTRVARELDVDPVKLKREFPAESSALLKAYADALKAKQDSAYQDAVVVYRDAALRLRLKGNHVGSYSVQKESRLVAFSRNTDRHRAMKEGMRLALEMPIPPSMSEGQSSTRADESQR